MSDVIGDLAMSDKKAEEPRWTIRGVRQEARERAIKAADLSDKSLGEWISEKLLAGWESDRAQTRMPAVIPAAAPPVTDLVAKPDEQLVANSARQQNLHTLDVRYHLEVLDAVIRFAHDSMTEPVRQAADRVIIDHLKELRVTRPRRTKRAESPTETAKLSDQTG